MKLPVLLVLAAFASRLWAADQEAETARFLQEAFGSVPAVQTLRFDAELRTLARAVLEHDYPARQLRYWRSGERSAWVLDEIGKELPITVGVAVKDGAVERMRVLVYRESRGFEVRSPAFLRQFDGARLAGGDRIDRSIDGISGATLSVRALSRLARLALLFHGRLPAAGTRP